MPLVGRTAALDELRAAWTHVATGSGGRPVVITGQAGTGKSALIRAAVDAIAPPALLTGAARVHSPAPYDWLAAVLAGRDGSGLGLPADALAWLAQDPHVPRERYTPEALLRLAVTAVRCLVGAGPAVIVVEDLHALDPASLNLVAELATAALPALLLVSSRPPATAVSPELAATTLSRLSGAGAARRHLTPLGIDHVGEILRTVRTSRSPAASASPSAPLPSTCPAFSARRTPPRARKPPSGPSTAACPPRPPSAPPPAEALHGVHGRGDGRS